MVLKAGNHVLHNDISQILSFHKLVGINIVTALFSSLKSTLRQTPQSHLERINKLGLNSHLDSINVFLGGTSRGCLFVWKLLARYKGLALLAHLCHQLLTFLALEQPRCLITLLAHQT